MSHGLAEKIHRNKTGRRLIEMAGQRFGRLLVLTRDIEAPRKRARWHAICDCGNQVVVEGSDLRAGKTKSCGCFRRECDRRKSPIEEQCTQWRAVFGMEV